MHAFPLGEDVDALREAVRRFAEAEIAPRAAATPRLAVTPPISASTMCRAYRRICVSDRSGSEVMVRL